MMMNKQKDEKLGDKKFKEGKENITTGIFNWSKDYASAASQFNEAFKYYQSAGCHQKCLKTLKQLIVCNEKLTEQVICERSNWAVARNYESIAEIYISNYPNTSLEEFKQVATAGFVNFRMSDSIDKGLTMVGRIANHLIKQGKMKEGVELLQDAYKTCLGEEKSYKKNQIFNQIVQVYLQNDIFVEAERMYQEEIKLRGGLNCQQMGLIVMILILIQGEQKRADKEMYELSNIIPNFLTSDECEVGDELCKAYKKGEVQKFKKLTTKAAVTCIFPIIIIRKLREVKIPSAQNAPSNEQEAHQEAVKNLLF